MGFSKKFQEAFSASFLNVYIKTGTVYRNIGLANENMQICKAFHNYKHKKGRALEPEISTPSNFLKGNNTESRVNTNYVLTQLDHQRTAIRCQNLLFSFSMDLSVARMKACAMDMSISSNISLVRMDDNNNYNVNFNEVLSKIIYVNMIVYSGVYLNTKHIFVLYHI